MIPFLEGKRTKKKFYFRSSSAAIPTFSHSDSDPSIGESGIDRYSRTKEVLFILQFTYQIQHKGFGVRSSGLLARLAKATKSDAITVTKGEKTVKAAQRFKLLRLGAKRGDEVKVTIDGPNENAVITQVYQLFRFHV